MIRNWKLGALLLVGALSATPASATIINLTVNGGFGLDIGRACTSALCTSSTNPWLNNTNYAATGTITIDDGALTLNATLSVAFSEITGPVANGITEIEYYTTTYTITNAPITIVPGGPPTVYQLNGSNSATVDPTTVTQVGTGGGSSNPIYNSVRVTGSCGLVAGNVGQCGLTFGFTNFPSGAPLNRVIQQTFNLAVVPEPATMVLVGAGIVGLGWVGRRRA